MIERGAIFGHNSLLDASLTHKYSLLTMELSHVLQITRSDLGDVLQEFEERRAARAEFFSAHLAHVYSAGLALSAFLRLVACFAEVRLPVGEIVVSEREAVSAADACVYVVVRGTFPVSRLHVTQTPRHREREVPVALGTYGVGALFGEEVLQKAERATGPEERCTYDFTVSCQDAENSVLRVTVADVLHRLPRAFAQHLRALAE